VSFNRKHNLANGENDRDGDNHNNSWNHGVEGPSTDPAVRHLRERQLRNLLSSLLLSPGVPMVLMGDEVRRSQGGNNNTWCQNNPLGWMHWRHDPADLALRLFVRRLISLRAQLAPLLNPEVPLAEAPPRRIGEGAALWREWHGVELQQPDWAAWSHSLAWSLHDGPHGPLLWCGMNAFYKAMHFALPPTPGGWVRLIDTALPPGQDFPHQAEPWSPPGVPLESRSLILMLSAPLAETLQLPE
ncbi:MAG: glycogen-debranching protein, partial [Cyanobium sp.]